ncbi:hypothetical protein ACHAQH_008590 [Verticillium albo-atrum]
MSPSKPTLPQYEDEQINLQPMKFAPTSTDTKTSARFSVACIFISMIPWLIIGAMSVSQMFSDNEQYMSAVLVFILAAQLMALTFAALSAQVAWPETQVGRFLAVGMGLGVSTGFVVMTYGWSIFVNYYARIFVGIGGLYVGLACEVATGVCQRVVESKSSTT